MEGKGKEKEMKKEKGKEDGGMNPSVKCCVS